MSDFAQINDWLWVGSNRACKHLACKHVIHIFRSDQPGQEDHCCQKRGSNLRMDYREGEPIDDSNLTNLAAFAQHIGAHPGPTLVHCAAGLCRGPTVAVYLLSVLDGLCPAEARDRVARAIREQRGLEANVPPEPLRQIMRLRERVEKVGPARPACRLGTVDKPIWHEAIALNLYGLPDAFGPDDWILNLGAHSGSVAWRCLRAGANVVAVEPDRDNYRLLCEHVAPWADRVVTVNGAAWRSDRPAALLPFHHNWQPANTGGGAVLGDAEAAHAVLAVAADDLLRLRPEWRLLVTDTEGSEFPCLYTSAELGRVREIVGEYHERGEPKPWADVGRPWTMAALQRFLESEGFAVEVRPAQNPAMGLFWARRP